MNTPQEPKILHAERLPIKPRMNLGTLGQYGQAKAAKSVIGQTHFALRTGNTEQLKLAVGGLIGVTCYGPHGGEQRAADFLSRLRKDVLRAHNQAFNAPEDAVLFFAALGRNINMQKHALIVFDGKASHTNATDAARGLFNDWNVSISRPLDRATVMGTFDAVFDALNVTTADICAERARQDAHNLAGAADVKQRRAAEEVQSAQAAVDQWFNDDWVAEQRKKALDRRNAAHDAFSEACDEVARTKAALDDVLLRLTAAFNGKVGA